ALSEDDEGEGGDCEKPKRKRRSKQDRFPRNLAAIVKNVLIPEEVQLDSDAYREIGEEHHDEISCTRSELYWERTVREKFVRKEDRAQPPVIPPAPEPSVPGTMCAAALMARILCDKYLDHLPHYRQATRIERRYDAEISRQTLNKWTHAAADFLSPIADAILAEIQLVGCLAHIRRKFYEAREQVPEVVMPILPSIQRLYRIEENLRQSGAPPGCRELVRRSKSRPIVNELQKKITAELGVHLPKSNPGKALRYALGQWSGFARYMKDGRLEIDNNLVENAIRPTKLGAKNYLFFGSATAGINSATIYTLMANRKALGIDLERYPEAVLKAMTARQLRRKQRSCPLQKSPRSGGPKKQRRRPQSPHPSKMLREVKKANFTTLTQEFFPGLNARALCGRAFSPVPISMSLPELI
ncbi:transposase, partial [Verrucomicrobiales bacterium]|nr:transposase [Verrucomicrobiales bacterium]